MKIEVWSDVMCPFCYIGKRKFEAALAQFPDGAKIELVWKSFQLDPELTVTKKQNTYEYLAERKGFSYGQSVEMHDNVTAMAAKEGLEYNFETSVVANSFDAHRLSHLAKKHGLGDAMEESLFRAYFTEGKDIADHATLRELGAAIGLDPAEITAVLESDAYAAEVRQDIVEAQQLGIRGVPFFVFDRKYAVSGAQPTDVFLETLKTSFGEWQQKNPGGLQVNEGPVCTPDGECD